MCVVVRVGMCVGMCVDMCVDMCVGMGRLCVETRARASHRHVCGHADRKDRGFCFFSYIVMASRRHVCGHADSRVC